MLNAAVTLLNIARIGQLLDKGNYPQSPEGRVIFGLAAAVIAEIPAVHMTEGEMRLVRLAAKELESRTSM